MSGCLAGVISASSNSKVVIVKRGSICILTKSLISAPLVPNPSSSSRGGARETRGMRTRRRTEVMPVKGPHTHTRIRPLALASGHGRYNVTVTAERSLFSVGEWPLHYI